MTVTRRVHVTVFGKPGHENMMGDVGTVICCGPQLTSKETTELLVDHLDRKYNGKASAEYVDLSTSENQAKFPEVVRAAEQDNLTLPLVAIDGELKDYGDIDFALICQEIERRS